MDTVSVFPFEVIYEYMLINRKDFYGKKEFPILESCLNYLGIEVDFDHFTPKCRYIVTQKKDHVRYLMEDFEEAIKIFNENNEVV